VKIAGPLTYSLFGINDSPNWITSVPAAGTRYRISAYVRAGALAGLSRLQVREWLNGTQQGATVFSPYVRLGTSWQLVSVDLLAFNAGSTIDVQVLDEPALGLEVFYVDAVSIQILKSAPTADETDAGPSAVLPPRVTPNPMFARGSLQFTTPISGPLRVELYDAAGRMVRVLDDEPFAPAGERVLEIDGHDQTGARLSAGVYFYRILSTAGRWGGRFAMTR
jgi:hypothetical protein